MIKPIKSRDKDACVTSAQGGMCCCCDGVKCSNVDVVLVSTIWDLSSVRIFDIAPNYAWPAQQRHARSRPGMGLCQNIFNFWEINATMKHFIMELYINSHHYVGLLLAVPLLGVSRPIFCSVSICMRAVKQWSCPVWPGWSRSVWAVQAGSPELPRHWGGPGQSPVSSPSSAWRAFKQTICIQTLNFFFHALKFVPWVVLLFSHYDTFLGRQNFSHLPHKTLLQIQILKACHAIGNF